MGTNFRVTNVTNGMRVKLTRARREIGDCTATWVDEGLTIRNLSPVEMLDAMNKRAAERDRTSGPLSDAELHGFHRTPRASMEHRLIRAAYGFASGQLGY